MDRRLGPDQDSNESHATVAARGANGASSDGGEWQRLERAVETLVDEHERLLAQNETLRGQVATKDRRIHELDEQLMEANQKRQEVGKRIQELIAQIDHLDAELGADSSAAEA
jgi:DNA repair exonuclease SbcCD ATPase subunit